MAKKKYFSVRITNGKNREVVHSMRFPKVEEAESAFRFACSCGEKFPFDVEMSSFNYDTKTGATSMWDSMRYRKYFADKHERDIFNTLCDWAYSDIALRAKAAANNEKPYDTMCYWIRDEFSFERLSLEKQSELAEAVCNYYGISIR